MEDETKQIIADLKDDMSEPVDESSSDSTTGNGEGSSSESSRSEDESSTGSLMSPCPDDVVCIALVVGDTAKHNLKLDSIMVVLR